MHYVHLYEVVIWQAVSHSPGPDKFDHTYAGLAIWLLAAALLRAPLSSTLPWGAVIVAEVANECVDRLANGTWKWPDTLGDAAATWFWPTVLMLFCRWRAP